MSTNNTPPTPVVRLGLGTCSNNRSAWPDQATEVSVRVLVRSKTTVKKRCHVHNPTHSWKEARAMASHHVAAAKRLRKELQNLERHPEEDDDVYLRPTNPEQSILRWTALLRGPKDTPYEGGVFQLQIACGSDYPLAPPTIAFVTKVFHPNVHFRTGDVCLDILKKEWSPAWGLQAACRAVLALLSDPDADSPLNCDAGNMVRGGDDLAFFYTAKMYTVENAMFLEWPEGGEQEEKRQQ